MSRSSITLEIKGLQAQLDTLKSLLAVSGKLARRQKKKGVPFAKLYGIWKGKVDLSFEEIAESKYTLPKNLLE